MRPTAARLLHDIVSTADVFLRESARLFRPLGLSTPQFNVLNLLAGPEAKGGYAQRRLAELLVVDRSNVTGLVDRMEAAGWVERRDDPEDRRVYRVALTPAGRRLWERAAPLYAEAVERVTARLKEGEMRAALATLETLRSDAARWEHAENERPA